MGDMGDYWRDVKAHKKERAEHYKANAENAIAQVAKVAKTMQNYNKQNNQWLIDGRVDWWPTSGTWIDRPTKIRGRGYYSLNRFLKEHQI